LNHANFHCDFDWSKRRHRCCLDCDISWTSLDAFDREMMRRFFQVPLPCILLGSTAYVLNHANFHCDLDWSKRRHRCCVDCDISWTSLKCVILSSSKELCRRGSCHESFHRAIVSWSDSYGSPNNEFSSFLAGDMGTTWADDPSSYQTAFAFQSPRRVCSFVIRI
jgi:hypothetical protein